MTPVAGTPEPRDEDEVRVDTDALNALLRRKPLEDQVAVPRDEGRRSKKSMSEYRRLAAMSPLDLTERIAALESEVAALLSEREAARQALFECFVHAGADTDGATTLAHMGGVDIAALAVRAVKELQADYDEDSV